MVFKKFERKSATEGIIEQITSYIEGERVKPGYKLPSEQELMHQFGVSRSTIREALHALVVLDVLESKPGKGYYVKHGYQLPLQANNLRKILLQDKTFFDLLEARESVERTIAVLAAQRATNDDIQAMEEALKGVQEAIGRGEDPTDYTVAVHLQMAHASHNEVLVGLMEQLLPMIAEKARKVQIPAQRNYEEHKDLVDGIKTGDPQALEKIITKHLGYIRNKFIEYLEASVVPQG